jgi:hypothetical protein
MDVWLSIWTWTLITGVVLFAGLSIAVIIGGAFDIRSLFRSLATQHQQQIDLEKDAPHDPSNAQSPSETSADGG